MDLNKFIGVGRIATDPIYSETAAVGDKPGSTRLEFRLVINRPRSEANDGVKCVVWGNYAKTMSEHLKKGKEIGVEGQLRTSRVAVAGEEGKFNYFFEIKVDSISLGADSKKGQTAEGGANAGASTTTYRMERQADGSVKRVPVEKAASNKTPPAAPNVSADQLAQLASQLEALKASLATKTAEAAPSAPEDSIPNDPFVL
jgi:single-strand DNA-binding protein